MSNSTKSTYPANSRALAIASIPAKPLQWLWPHRFPRGKISLLAGDPGAGKTALILDLAARLSRNDRLPPFPPTPNPTPNLNLNLNPNPNPPVPTPTPNPTPNLNPNPNPNLNPPNPESLSPPPAATLLLSPEDNLADTLRPRLESLHADISLIHTLPTFHSLVEPVLIDGTPVPPLQHLEYIIQSLPNLALLVIDPITYYLGLTDRLLPSRPDSIPSPRSTLHALAHLASKHNLALLLTTRLAKKCPDADPTSLRRALGSLAFAAAARTVHLLLPNSTLADPNHTLLVPLKNNLAELPPALSFLPADRLEWDPDPIFIQDPQKPLPRHEPPEESQLGEGIKFLRAALADGPVRATSLQSQAQENLLTLGTLRRAKEFLDCDAAFSYSRKAWYWSLKGDTRPILTYDQEVEKEMRISLEDERRSFQALMKSRLEKIKGK